MMKFPKTNLVYKGEEARNSIKCMNNRIEILQGYLHDPASIPKDISIIQVSSLKILINKLFGYLLELLVGTLQKSFPDWHYTYCILWFMKMLSSTRWRLFRMKSLYNWLISRLIKKFICHLIWYFLSHTVIPLRV
jgi:hypothetical protein